MRWFLILCQTTLALSLLAQDKMTVMRLAHHDMDILCGSEMHGRGYVNHGDSLAARYLEEQFQQLALRQLGDSYLQPFSFPVNTFPVPMKVKLDGELLVPGEDYLLAPNSGSDAGSFHIKHIRWVDLMNAEVDLSELGQGGNWALELEMPDTKDADTLALYGALLQEFQQMGPVITTAKEKLVWSVSQSAAPHVVIELKPGVLNERAQNISLDVRSEFRPEHTANNVVGYVRGSKKKKDLIVVSAHYDHLGRMGEALFPGANDNASGVSMLLALARHFSQKPALRSVVFLLFAGEEAGLVGSRYFVQNPLIDLDRVNMLINLDIMGTGDDGIMVVNATKEAAIYEKLVSINEKSDRLAAVKKRGPACNSDHCPFAERGIPSVFIYTLGGIAHYHNVFDKPETLPLTEFHDIYLTLIDLINSR